MLVIHSLKVRKIPSSMGNLAIPLVDLLGVLVVIGLVAGGVG